MIKNNKSFVNGSFKDHSEKEVDEYVADVAQIRLCLFVNTSDLFSPFLQFYPFLYKI